MAVRSPLFLNGGVLQETSPDDILNVSEYVTGAKPFINGTVLGPTGSNLLVGDNDIYTVPSGKSFLLLNSNVFNGAGGANTIYATTKVGGIYYRMTASTSLAANASQAFLSNTAFEAGDVLSLNCTAAGANCFISGVLYDESSAIKPQRKLGLTTGNNTLYTCPSGKVAQVIGSSSFDGISSIIRVANGPGTRSIYFNVVPSGGSPNSTNRFSSAGSLTANNAAIASGLITLNAGDFINLNIDLGTAAQSAWLKVLELEA
jgi:hypothetical protein